MAKTWWIWGVGALALVVLGGPLLGAVLGAIGLVLVAVFAVVQAGVGLAFSLLGMVLGALVNLLVLGGLGYLGYRAYRAWRPRARREAPPRTDWPGARGSHE